MRELFERGYFVVCVALGWLLRSARYSKVRIVDGDGDGVRKRRAFYAPLLIWSTGPLVKILDIGVRVLPQPDWEERERQMYRCLYGASIRVEDDGTLILPCLAGATLACLLENENENESMRKRGIESAVVALAGLHRLGFTHGDAMAENVMIDVEAGVARWFDFETVHDSHRSMDWRRADDLRALLATCLVRTIPDKRAETVQLILDAYADERITHVLATSFTSIFRRSLSFHLAQAGLSCSSFQQCATLCATRQSDPPARRAERARSTP